MYVSNTKIDNAILAIPAIGFSVHDRLGLVRKTGVGTGGQMTVTPVPAWPALRGPVDLRHCLSTLFVLIIHHVCSVSQSISIHIIKQMYVLGGGGGGGRTT